MLIKLPQPLHGWRAFVGEVGVIVLGVLIALGLGQLVQDWNDGQNAEAGRAAMRTELAGDDLPQAYARLAVSPCLARSLDRLDAAEVGTIDRLRFGQMAKLYQPQVRTWDAEAWKAVIASGALSNRGAKEIMAWASPYVWVAKLDLTAGTESQALTDLTSVKPSPGRLTDPETDRVVVSLQRLRRIGRTMFRQSWFLSEAARNAGVTLSDRERSDILASLRPDWGPCVQAPKLPRINLTSQIMPPLADPF